MKYVLLISHGGFAEGLKSSLEMFAGDKAKDVIAVGLKNGESADKFGEKFRQVIEGLDETASFVILADIIGGSPLTTAANVLAEKGKLSETVILGGMNFPMALNAVLLKDSVEGQTFAETVLGEATTGIQQFNVATDDDGDDI